MEDPTRQTEENKDETEKLEQMQIDFDNIGTYVQKCKKILSRKATYRMYPTRDETEAALTTLDNLKDFNEDIANDLRQTQELLLLARDKKWKLVKNIVIAVCVEIDTTECKYLQKESIVSMLNKPPSVELANFDVWKECAMLRMCTTTDGRAVHDPGGDNYDEDFMNEFLPSQIAKQFCSIYDVNWSEAYKQVKLHFDEEKEEEQIIKEMSTIIQLVTEYTEDKVKVQMDKMGTAMAKVVTAPIKQKSAKTSRSSCSDQSNIESQPVNQALLPYARIAVRNTAEFTLPILLKEFNAHIVPGKMKYYLALEKFTSLILICANLTWHLNSLEQPMVLLWPSDVSKEDLFQYFRYFTKFGTELDHGVWPALLLCKDGPVMVKGVAQLK